MLCVWASCRKPVRASVLDIEDQADSAFRFRMGDLALQPIPGAIDTFPTSIHKHTHTHTLDLPPLPLFPPRSMVGKAGRKVWGS